MSRQAYDYLRDSGFIRLPSSRTLYNYSHYTSSATGFNKDIIEMMKLELYNPCSKLTRAHTDLTAFSCMKVSLAAQVMSDTVAHALEDLNDDRLVETINFIRNFLTKSVRTRVGDFSASQRASIMLSHQTITGLRMSVASIISCDPLEQYFGHLRHKSGDNNNSSLYDEHHNRTKNDLSPSPCPKTGKYKADISRQVSRRKEIKMNSAEDRINIVKEDENHDTQNISQVKTSSVNKSPIVPKVSYADNEVENMTESNGNINNEAASLPKRKSSIWVIVRDKMSLTEKGSTPLNWKVLSLVFLSLFCSSMTLTFLFPFLPEMILEKGYYAGIVASAVFLGRAFGSYFWGWLSDKKGRKPVMLLTISLNGICCLIFGFTTNWSMAVVLRFLNGLVNGTVGTAKTILYEMSDNSNQALGMSAISVAWGSGIILGPAIGVVFIISVIGFVLDWIFLPETLGMRNAEIKVIRKKKKDNQVNDEVSDEKDLAATAKIAMSVEDLHCESDAAVYHCQKQAEKDTELQSEIKHTDDSDENNERCKLLGDKDYFQKVDDNEIKLSEDSEYNSKPSKHVNIEDNCKTLSDKESDSKHKNDSDERCKLLDDEDQKQNFDPDDAGIVIDVSGEQCKKTNINGCSAYESTSEAVSVQLPQTDDQFLTKSSESKKIREGIFLYTSLSFAIIGYDEVFAIWASTDKNLVIPVLHLLQNNETLLWPFIIILLMPQKVAGVCCFSATALFINNSVKPQYAGSVNGIAMTITAIARTFAPTFGGSMYAWSITYGSRFFGPPFDVSFSFFIFGIIVWITLFVNAILDFFVKKKIKFLFVLKMYAYVIVSFYNIDIHIHCNFDN
ncbi:LOW QUALITY PROTEIN: hypothetical protein KUTeg_009378 [Tegillarca granosa]|uniref:Major facilitator superfamily (MFS) profile domain-containing protein n=1 Tax=Tegillarca granosa TaxID=220873 RepID=A0ABQ9F3N6_TEGGR|nr:LOW QUALITY PROTEIN: hypothetical protein KUTeg_009378 [Tegillarca granosa]